MDLWVEIKLDGVVKGQREHLSVMPYALWSKTGINYSNLYSRTCNQTTTCACDSGDVLISGGAKCDGYFPCFLLYSNPVGYDSWEAACMDASRYPHSPIAINIVCLHQ